MRIFISYSRDDSDFALHLCSQLQQWGYDTWIDVQNIAEGVYWPDAIDEGLETSNACVGIISPNSMQSSNVKNEWDWALENDTPLILLRLRECSISHRYIRLNYIDFVDDQRAGFERLAQALEHPQTMYRHAHIRSTTPSESVTPPRPAPADRRARDNRSRLLDKVREFWIEGVLEKALLQDNWLELTGELQPGAVQPPIERELQNPAFTAHALSSGQQIAQVFNDLGRELLILGEPGSGKTMTLLELARDLIAAASADSAALLPVVLNLSSWAETRPPFDTWLVERLNVEYQVPRKIGQRWIENGQLIYLLDGLDEVQLQHRDDCVDAINTFWRDYNFIDNGIAVCSRIQDYDVLITRLHLENAIVLKPLTSDQSAEYLNRLGADWVALKDALPGDVVLRQFAESPLLLNIMAAAYRGLPANQITGFKRVEDQRRHLLDHYVTHCLRSGSGNPHYTFRQIHLFLEHLAQQMVRHGQTVFYIEQLQPDWLPAGGARREYRAGSSLLLGMVIGLLTVLAAIAAWGLIGDLLFLKAGLLAMPIFAVGIGLFSALFFEVMARLRHQSDRDINVVETLSWSWPRVASALLGGIVGALVGGLIRGFDVGLIVGLSLGTFFALIFGLIGGQVEMRTRPNQGIWRSFRNSSIAGIGLGLSGAGLGLAGGSMLGVSDFARRTVSTWGLEQTLVLGILGALGGIVFGLGLFGGIAVTKHVVLRALLWRLDCAPLDYAHFLDHTAGQKLLRKVGGGYIFRHRMLMEFFAKPDA